MQGQNEIILYGLTELKSLKKYRQVSAFRSSFQLITSFLPYIALWTLAYYCLNYSYVLTLFILIFNLGFAARIFILQHDCGHGSLFKSRKVQNVIGCCCSLITLIPYHYWRKVHAIHHASTGNLDRRSPGEFPLFTVKEYLEASEKEQKQYRFIRHPLTLLFFVPGMLFYIFYRIPRQSPEFTSKEKYSVYLTDFALFCLFAILIYALGWRAFLAVHLPLTYLTSMIAVYLFYVQHQYEQSYWAHEPHVDFYQASLQGSSFLKMPALLNWFTGNVGYHHIHHLSPMIPNYHLAQCHQENPGFHQVPTLRLLDGFQCLNLSLWDESKQRLVSFKEVHANQAAGLKSSKA